VDCLRGWGISPAREPECRRLDVAVTLEFASSSQGVAFMSAVAQVPFPRQKLEVIGTPPETIYGLTLRRARRVWRCYDYGNHRQTAPRGRQIRLEDPWRPSYSDMPFVSTLGAKFVRERFWRRFEPLLVAPSIQTVKGADLLEELVARKRRGEIEYRSFERMFSYLSAESHGLDRDVYGKEERKTRRREARRLGLRPTEHSAAGSVDVAAVLEQAHSPAVWGVG
jgi:hypothetical protein